MQILHFRNSYKKIKSEKKSLQESKKPSVQPLFDLSLSSITFQKSSKCYVIWDLNIQRECKHWGDLLGRKKTEFIVKHFLFRRNFFFLVCQTFFVRIFFLFKSRAKMTRLRFAYKICWSNWLTAWLELGLKCKVSVVKWTNLSITIDLTEFK